MGFTEAARNRLADADQEDLNPESLVGFTQEEIVNMFKNLRREQMNISTRAEKAFQTFRFLCTMWHLTDRPLKTCLSDTAEVIH